MESKQQKRRFTGKGEEKMAKKEFTNMQMLEIKKGIQNGIDTSVYNNIEYQAEQMREIRLGMEQGVDVSKYLNQKFNQYEMEQIRLGLSQEGFEQYIEKGFQADQLEQIRLGLEKGIDVSQYAVGTYQGSQMEQIRLGLQTGLDVTQFNHPAMSSGQMQEIRHTMMVHDVLDKIKEQLKRILDTFLYTAKLHISIPTKEVGNKMNPKIREILSSRAEEIVKEKVLELEAQKEPESAEEVVAYIEKELKKEEVQEQFLSEPVLTEMEAAAQEALEEYAEQQEERRKLVEEQQIQIQEEIKQQQEVIQSEEQNQEGKTENQEQEEEEQEPIYHEDPKLNDAMKDYVLFRKEIGKPLLDVQIHATLSYVASMEPDTEKQARILNQSVVNGWEKLYPIKEQKDYQGKYQGKQKQAPNHGFTEREYGKDFYDNLNKKLMGKQFRLEEPILEGSQEAEICVEELEI